MKDSRNFFKVVKSDPFINNLKAGEIIELWHNTRNLYFDGFQLVQAFDDQLEHIPSDKVVESDVYNLNTKKHGKKFEAVVFGCTQAGNIIKNSLTLEQ